MTTSRAIVLAVVSSILSTVAQVLWKIGIGNESELLRLLFEPYIIGGIFLLGVAAFCMTFALKEGELSVIHPVLALGYVWILFASGLIGETISITQYAGVGTIMVGVGFITKSRRKE